MKKLSRILLFICIAAVAYSVVAFQREVVASCEKNEQISEQISEPKIEAEEASFDTRWSELPERIEGDFLKYKTYFTTLSDSTVVRNYSICYDTQKMVSRWVAYPLHEVYTTPKIERTDAWAFDDAITTYGEGGYDIIGYELTEPVIPQYLQPNVKAGGFNDGENRKLDRGHMLPSASRYNSWQTNAQTFYATNIFPQNARLNQQNWAEVEDRARRSMCADTLYVVVGTLFENPTTFHSRGRHLAWPSHCYKLLLRTRSGNTGKSIAQIDNAEDIMAIGFLFENTTEGNVEPADAVASIAEIEARSGLKFFPTLNPSIEKAVKEQKNIADWGAFR